MNDLDILMITYNRPKYTAISLKRLLENCNETMRVWVWHNGADEETLSIVNSFRKHPAFYQFYHSIENKKLNEPTNWMWTGSNGQYLAKVDDDCLMPMGWAQTLRKAHYDNSRFGVIGCWHFPEEDIVPELASQKIQAFQGGHRLMRNCWLGGSGYVMKRECFSQLGPLKRGQSFSDYCIRLSMDGYIHGWYYPFIFQEHFDDPRSSYSLLRSDEDIKRWAPLSAINNGVTTISGWTDQLKRSAKLLQEAPYDPKYYSGWRRSIKRIKSRILRLFGYRQQW